MRVRLLAGRRIIELQNELLAAREILRETASHDSLSGLLIHEEILGVMDKDLARSERDGVCVSIIMADIDHFKNVNDTYGHLAGDAVLRLTARIMNSIVRSYDSIGRYGGEEFLIVLPECCLERAAAFAERLRSNISRDSIDTPEGMIPVTISPGVAASSSDGRRDKQTLVRARSSLQGQGEWTQPCGNCFRRCNSRMKVGRTFCLAIDMENVSQKSLMQCQCWLSLHICSLKGE